MMLAVWCT